MYSVGQWIMMSLVLCGLALATPGRAAGQDHSAELAEAQQLDKQIAALYDANNFSEAIILAERALAIRERVLGPDDPTVATSLNDLGFFYYMKGDYARAEPPYLRALEIRNKIFPPEHPDVVRSLNNLAMLYADEGDYVRAEHLFLRVLAIKEKLLGPEGLDVANPVTSLAFVYKAKGDYVSAEPLFERALAIRAKVLGPEHPEATYALTLLARFHSDSGDYFNAEQTYKRLLEIYQKIYGPKHPYVATSLSNLASLYISKGDYASAEPLAKRALEMREEIFGKEDTAVAESVNLLGTLYDDQEDFVRAERLYKRALAIHEKVLGPKNSRTAISLDNLANLYKSNNYLALAEPLYERSLRIQEALGPDRLRVAGALSNLGALYVNQADYRRAEPLFNRALDIMEKIQGPWHPALVVPVGNLSALYEAQGKIAQSVQFARRAEDIEEHNLGLNLLAGSEGQKQLYLNTLSGSTKAIVSLHVRSAPHDQQAARLALTSILRRKGRALDAMTDQITAVRQHAAPADQLLLDQLSSAQSQRAKLRLSEGDINEHRTPEQRKEEAARLTTESDNLQAQISRRSAEFRILTQPVTLEDVQQAVPKDAALVEIFAYRPFDAKAASDMARFSAPRYVAYVLKRMGAVTFVDLGPTEAIDRAADRFLDAISNPASSDAMETGRALDEIVARPIRKLLGGVQNVLISPDGKLNLVPFAALVDQRGKYLVENYTITYLTSGRDLLRLNVPRQSKQTPVVFANPAFDVAITDAPVDTATTSVSNHGSATETLPAPSVELRSSRRSSNMRGTKWSELRGTAQEAMDLKALMPNALVLTDKNATEAALKKVVAPRILHLATHGFFLPDEPRDPRVKTVTENPLLRSGLVLAGANTFQGGGDEDGVLTALEAAGLNLWGTQLVVLSACETGVGDVRSGEGVYGLRRALVLAGAQSEVMTLWKVDDTATSEVISEYYRRLQAGEGRTEALRQVQLEFLRRKTRQHPFFWASLILNGDWRSMREKEANR